MVPTTPLSRPRHLQVYGEQNCIFVSFCLFLFVLFETEDGLKLTMLPRVALNFGPPVLGLQVWVTTLDSSFDVSESHSC